MSFPTTSSPVGSRSSRSPSMGTAPTRPATPTPAFGVCAQSACSAGSGFHATRPGSCSVLSPDSDNRELVVSPGSWTQEDLDGFALIHGLITGGGLIEWQFEVADLSRVDLAVPDQVDKLGE